MVDSADKKAKEAEKITNVATLKVLLIESNASWKRSQDIIKKEVPKQEGEINKMEEKLKLLNLKHQPVTGSTILVTDLSVHMWYT